MNTIYIDLAKSIAVANGLDPKLVCAVCEQESSWNPWANRMEEGFEHKYVDKLHLGITEAINRSQSWGLMQLMGEVAREEGFTLDIPSLCDPTTGITRGCIHLKKMLALGGSDVHAGLQHWNGGGNPNYASEVLARLEHYT